MAIDTPAKIAVLGAGPIGLEAALYARFLGYDVVIYDQGDVGNHVLRWGHVRMFTPFGMNRTPLGLAAIAAQDENYRPPDDDAILTGREWVERYLVPLSQTDLLADHLRLHTRVIGVSKEEILKRELQGNEERGDWPFRILSRNQDGHDHVEEADAVIDSTGVFSQANWAGHGGIPAVGELALRKEIEYRTPDVLGAQRDKYVGRHTLLIGNGFSAATTAVALAQLSREVPETRVTWISRGEAVAGQGGPMLAHELDPLPERTHLVLKANELARAQHEDFVYWPRTTVQAIEKLTHTEGYRVTLLGQHAGTLSFDLIVANVGFRPDRSLYEELQVEEDTATQAPRRLAEAVGGRLPRDARKAILADPQALVTTEPNFYLLGAKSFGRNPNFLVVRGLEQIRQLFTILGDRPTLDLYSGAIKLQD